MREEHSGKWVALTRDYSRVVASGESMAEVSHKAEGQDFVMMLVPDFDRAFAPQSQV
ncbi:MAG: hypothetical protein HYT87_02015 [Nitrospirae bacterium]|nr:hypothetical protein [Nitrospirota bacterium]